MKRFLVLFLPAIVAVSCSPQPDSSAIAQWTKALTTKKALLTQTDTVSIRQLLDETDAQLTGFRSGQFRDTLSLAEGQLIDSVLVEKSFLQQSLVNLRAAVRQLNGQLEELPKVKQAIDEQSGTVSERNKLLSSVEKDVHALTEHATGLSASISGNCQLLSKQSEQLKLISIKYFFATEQ